MPHRSSYGTGGREAGTRPSGKKGAGLGVRGGNTYKRGCPCVWWKRESQLACEDSIMLGDERGFERMFRS